MSAASPPWRPRSNARVSTPRLVAESASRDAALTTTRLLEEQHDAHKRDGGVSRLRTRRATRRVGRDSRASRRVEDGSRRQRRESRASHASNRCAARRFRDGRRGITRRAVRAREAALLRAAFTGADGTCEDSLVHAVLASISEETARGRADDGVASSSTRRRRARGAVVGARPRRERRRRGRADVLRLRVGGDVSRGRECDRGGWRRGGGVGQGGAGDGGGAVAAAADALESGTKGTAAERAVAGWVADARERQRMEMAMTVLQDTPPRRRQASREEDGDGSGERDELCHEMCAS